MSSSFKLQCPNCKCVLEISEFQGNDQTVLTCPNCKTPNAVGNYIKNPGLQQRKASDCATQLNLGQSGSDAGRSQSLLDLRTGNRFNLTLGRHLVGRRTSSSPSVADIALDTDDMGISRSHFYIDMYCMDDGRIKAVLGNAKNKNMTYVNGDLLGEEDRIVLHNRDVIKISQTELKYYNE